jgi:hypothetical protein
MPTANAPATTARETAIDHRRGRQTDTGMCQPMPVIVPQPGLCITIPVKTSQSFMTW